MVWEEMLFEEIRDGHHLNRTILAKMNLCVTFMPPIKFWLNLTCRLGGDVI